MQSKAKTVSEYLSDLTPDRRAAIDTLRKVFLKNLPKGYEEGMQYGMIGYYVPHSIFPAGYHCDPKQPLPFGSIASQKNHMAMYLMCIYANPDLQAWFRKAWTKSGRKLDMGKGCIRFKKIEDVPLDVVAAAVRRVPVKKFVEFYQSILDSRTKRPSKSGARKAPTKPTSSKKAAARRAVSTGKKTGPQKATKRRTASKTS